MSDTGWDPENSRTISVQTAARRLGIGRGLAYRLARSGEIPAIRLGRRLVVPVTQLEVLLSRGSRRINGVKQATNDDGSVGPEPRVSTAADEARGHETL